MAHTIFSPATIENAEQAAASGGALSDGDGGSEMEQGKPEQASDWEWKREPKTATVRWAADLHSCSFSDFRRESIRRGEPDASLPAYLDGEKAWREHTLRLDMFRDAEYRLPVPLRTVVPGARDAVVARAPPPRMPQPVALANGLGTPFQRDVPGTWEPVVPRAVPHTCQAVLGTAAALSDGPGTPLSEYNRRAEEAWRNACQACRARYERDQERWSYYAQGSIPSTRKAVVVAK